MTGWQQVMLKGIKDISKESKIPSLAIKLIDWSACLYSSTRPANVCSSHSTRSRLKNANFLSVTKPRCWRILTKSRPPLSFSRLSLLICPWSWIFNRRTSSRLRLFEIVPSKTLKGVMVFLLSEVVVMSPAESAQLCATARANSRLRSSLIYS